MAKFRPIINSLATGEIMPDMAGRTDHQKYASALERCRDYITRPHGSAYRRPGTRHIRPAKHADKAAALLRFDFQNIASQSYMLELGHQYLRFFHQGGIVLNGSGQPYELATPWTEAQVKQVRVWQSFDVMYMVHPNVAPQKLIRRGHTDWELSAMDFRIPGWDLSITDTNADGKKDGKQGDTIALADGRSFDKKMIVKGENPAGAVRWYEYHGDGFWKASGAALTLTFKDTPSTASGSLEIKAIHTAAGVLNTDWIELERDNSAPEKWTGTNWPGLVGCYEDRMVFAATPDQPYELWFTRTGERTDLRKNTSSDGEPLDDDAIWREVSGTLTGPLQWLMDAEDLLAGTNRSEVRIWSGTDGEPLTPKACQIKFQGAQGSANIPAAMAGNVALYVSRTGRKVRKYAFDFGSYKYNSRETTLLAQHITGPGIVAMAYAVEPDGVLWCARSDGLLASCTFLPEEDVVGWHLHTLGGEGLVESLATIPGDVGDELWLLVRRKNADGSVRRDIERMEPRFEALNQDGTMKEDAREAFCVDSGLTYRGVAKTEIDGLGHLEGKELQVLADGAVVGPVTVSGGKITLPNAAELVHAGLGYGGYLQTLPLDIPLQTGTTQSMMKRVKGVVVRLIDTVGGAVAAGTSETRIFEPLLPDVQAIVPGQPRKLVNGVQSVSFTEPSELDAVISIKPEGPLPMTVVSIIPEVIIG